MTAVTWQGEFSLDGMLALMAGGLIEPMGRRNFEAMAERLQNALLQCEPRAVDAPADRASGDLNFFSHDAAMADN